MDKIKLTSVYSNYIYPSHPFPTHYDFSLNCIINSGLQTKSVRQELSTQGEGVYAGSWCWRLIDKTRVIERLTVSGCIKLILQPRALLGYLPAVTTFQQVLCMNEQPREECCIIDLHYKIQYHTVIFQVYHYQRFQFGAGGSRPTRYVNFIF